jgi:hypothetical protein
VTSDTIAADIALKVSVTIGYTVLLILLSLSGYSFIEHRKEITFQDPRRRWRVSLFLSCLCASCEFTLFMPMIWYSWVPGVQDDICGGLDKFGAILYMLEKQFLYLFLYDRAKMVHMSLTLGIKRDKLLMYLRWMMFLTVTAGIPLTFYWAAFVTFTGSLYILPGDCIYVSIFPIVPVVFAITDISLAGGMFILFAAPLMRHRRMVKENSPIVGHKLDRLISRNAKLSFIAIASGLIALIGLATFNYLGAENPSMVYLRGWGGFMISWDHTVGLTAAHAMTNAWLPKKLQQFVTSRTGAGTEQESAGASSPKSKSNNKKPEPQNNKDEAVAFGAIVALETPDIDINEQQVDGAFMNGAGAAAVSPITE